MNTSTISPVVKDLFLILQNPVRHTVRTTSPALRIVLVGSEELRLPTASAWTVHILSGIAWISYGGKDFNPAAGEQVTIPAVKHGAIISAANDIPLCIEITKEANSRRATFQIR